MNMPVPTELMNDERMYRRCPPGAGSNDFTKETGVNFVMRISFCDRRRTRSLLHRSMLAPRDPGDLSQRAQFAAHHGRQFGRCRNGTGATMLIRRRDRHEGTEDMGDPARPEAVP